MRKKAEHNEGEISTLEELSLHQQDIERFVNSVAQYFGQPLKNDSQICP